MASGYLPGDGIERREDLQQFLCTGSKLADSPAFFAEHLNDHKTYFTAYGESFIFRGLIRSANGGYQSDSRITRWVFGD